MPRITNSEWGGAALRNAVVAAYREAEASADASVAVGGPDYGVGCTRIVGTGSRPRRVKVELFGDEERAIVTIEGRNPT